MADYTVADVLAWARTKPADERYDFCQADACAGAQFGAATDRNLNGLLSRDLERIGGYDFLMALVLGGTFSGLVCRLEKLVPETPVPPSNWSAIDAYMTDIEAVTA